MMLVNDSFLAAERTLITALLEADQIDRVTWHALQAPAPTRELTHVRVRLQVADTTLGAQLAVKPNLPWAEDQFRERVGGQPLNPPPSHEWWPYAEKGNARHVHEGQFSHTYPERMWPKFANIGNTRPNGRPVFVPHNGIRYEYGDLEDLTELLRENPYTRQAYLPIWFPEDLAAARKSERVPCSLGYHFLLQADGTMDCEYTIRSCDFARHFRDDVYLAMRLLQFVTWSLEDSTGFDLSPITVGNLYMSIGSLHCFPPDEQELRSRL